MTQSFPIFVINLPKSTAWRDFITEQMEKIGVTYEFVEGVYGTDERVVREYDEKRAIKEHGKPLLPGEKGCAMAHILLYERIVKEKIPFTVILEDDIIIPHHFISLVEREIHKKNIQWDWLNFDYRYAGFAFLHNWLVANYETIKRKPLFFFYAAIKTPYMVVNCFYEEFRLQLAKKFPSFSGAMRFFRPLYNTGAYVITYEGAKKLLPFTKPLRMSADRTPNIARLKINFRLFGYMPVIVRQNDEFKSRIIDHSTPELKEKYKGKYFRE